MQIVGCDLHTRYQQIAMLDQETGELVEYGLEHANNEVRVFYRRVARVTPQTTKTLEVGCPVQAKLERGFSSTCC